MTEYPSIAGGAREFADLYSIKRHGVTITNCEREPVHTPGCIQDRGALLVLRATDFTVLQASENSERWLGTAPGQLLGRPVSDLLGDEGVRQLRQALSADQLRTYPARALILPARNGVPALDALVHLSEDVVVLEFEAVATTEPVHLPNDYAIVSRFMRALQDSASLPDFCQRLADQVRQVTGIDRVMIYRFHEDAHGEVIAESRRADLESWLGLHYPASDIPPQVREIFCRLWVRPLPDATLPVMELVPLANPDTGRPLDMTYCSLRGPSVMYTEYLANMGVAATLTMPLRHDGRLWGLIACHHYSPTQFPFDQRAACEVLAQFASGQLKAAEARGASEYHQQIEQVHDELLQRAAGDTGLLGILEGEPGPLAGIAAGGFALRQGMSWHVVGLTPSTQQLQEMAQWLRARPPRPDADEAVFHTDRLAEEFAPASEYPQVASGVLGMRLGGPGGSLLLWFRPETAMEIHWAGNPDDKPMTVGPHGPRLTPRGSFELFLQSVRNRSLPWTTVEVAAVGRLRRLLTDLILRQGDAVASAREASDAKTAFLANMSHEIRTPLNSIIGMSQIMREDGLSEDQSQHLHLIDQSAHHLLDVINQILDISKIEAGKLQLEHDTLDLGQLLRNSALMVADKVAARGLELVVEPAVLPGGLEGDATRLTQALLNYLSNAIKFSESGRISLRAQVLEQDPQSALVRFEVEDEGIGVSPEHVHRLFLPFQQGDVSDTRRHGGTGLGLAITRRLAELMGGSTGYSSAAGRGSSFWFTARLARSAGPARRPAAIPAVIGEAERIARDHTGKRVLVVDDDTTGRMIVTRFLERVGLTVDQAVDGVDALAQADAVRYDLILMDLQMPRLDGLGAARRILALPDRSEVPIVALTANAFSEDRSRCLAAGMRDHLAKPIVRETLYATLLKWL